MDSDITADRDGPVPPSGTSNERSSPSVASSRSEDPLVGGQAPPPSRPRGPRGWRAVALAVLLAGSAGFASATFIGGQSDVTPRAEPAESTAPVQVISPGSEPVAAVADALSPSVVQIETGSGVGSGVIYDSDGLIITAAHVVEGGADVTVRLADGTRIPGEVVGADERTDVAVVRVERDGLPAATLAVGVPLRVGQLTVAIGSPFGLEGSVTAGVVSAIDRSIPTQGGVSMTMIQTDAPINPGNSGGALADARGRVIGINDSIRTTNGVNSGVGFAIPIDIAAQVAGALVRGEEPALGFLGISGTEPSSGGPGVLVGEVTSGGPAASAGIRQGDLITRYGGEAIEGMSELGSLIRRTAPGTVVSLEVVRDGREMQIDVRIGQAP
jgi:S1-C subfamily serine protease